MTPAVSVILPFRDAAPTLEAALQSLAAQTLSEIEILAVDDQSTDGGAEIVRRVAASDPRFRLLDSKAPHGVVAAVNTVWPLCRAPLIARMDADDVSLPRRLAEQVGLLRNHPELDGASCLVCVPDAGEGFQRYVDWSNSLRTPEAIHRERFVECPVVNPTLLVRREAVESVGGHLDPDWPEDYDLWLRFLEAGHRIAKVPEILYRWSDAQEGRLTRSDERYSERNFLRTRAHYLARIPEARERGFALCGAGPIGKRLAQFLQGEGAAVECFFEVSAKRVGETIHGIPVRSGRSLPQAEPSSPILLACVGSPGGRDRVRGVAREAGYTEGSDFYCCA